MAEKFMGTLAVLVLLSSANVLAIAQGIHNHAPIPNGRSVSPQKFDPKKLICLAKCGAKCIGHGGFGTTICLAQCLIGCLVGPITIMSSIVHDCTLECAYTKNTHIYSDTNSQRNLDNLNRLGDSVISCHDQCSKIHE